MSSLFSSPKRPKTYQVAEPEPVAMIEEDAEAARRREKKKLQRGGRQSTILSGIQSSLKKRLGA